MLYREVLQHLQNVIDSFFPLYFISNSTLTMPIFNSDNIAMNLKICLTNFNLSDII